MTRILFAMMEPHSPLLRYRREIRPFVPFVIPIVKTVESWYNTNVRTFRSRPCTRRNHFWDMCEMTAKQKQLGAFYTPEAMADFLVGWAVRRSDDIVLDPGCGEGVFLLTAYHRLCQLGASAAQTTAQIYGVELEQRACERARDALQRTSGLGAYDLICEDFFQVFPDLLGPPLVDVVLGNPPYIRYHHFTGDTRRRALKAAERAGVRLTRLTSAWAPYLVHAVSFLKPGGRLAMVVPAELLQVDYARPVRRFLLDHFANVTVVAFEERVFPGALEDTVLLLAESDGQTRGLRVVRLQNLEGLADLAKELDRLPLRCECIGEDKWTRFLLADESIDLYESLVERADVRPLDELAAVDIGVVTGNNDYFLLTETAARWWEIEPRFLRPAAPKARLMPGAVFTAEEWATLRDTGARSFLLDCREEPRQAKQHRVWRYITDGVARGVHKGYKCRTRSPWYGVPGVRVPPAFLTYMAHEIPRLIANHAGAVNHNLIHGVYFEDDQPEAVALRVASFYNTLTMLSAELVGRSYGGGVLKLETKESERTQLIEPADETTRQHLLTALDQIDAHLRRRAFDKALAIGDAILLQGQLALDEDALRQLRLTYHSLRGRRMSRAHSNT